MEILLPSLIVFFDFVMPVAVLLWLWRSKSRSRLYLLSIFALAAAYLVAVKLSFIGFWHIVGNLLPLLFFVALAAIAARRLRGEIPAKWFPSGQKETIVLSINILHASAWALVIAAALQARTTDEAAVELSSPLRGGTFAIMGGEGNISVNQHTRSVKYAMDIAKVNSLGMRAGSFALFPDDLTSYRIYGADVIAPCSGEITGIENDVPDQKPLQPSFDSIGNRVAIFCRGHTIRLLHLKPGSVRVVVGEKVDVGQLIASVGNSGNSVEPHLHIDAVAGRRLIDIRNDSGVKSVPIRIDGRFMVKGETFGVPGK